MEKIGNIIGSARTPLSELFNVNCCITDSLPTLYVGIVKASENIGDFSLLKYDYDGDIHWTPSRNEKRDIYNEKTEEFVSHCIRRYMSGIRYEYVNFTCYGYNRVKKLILYLRNKDRKYCFITRGGRFIFIYSERYRTVWGISLSMCGYIGVNKGKVIGRIRKNKSNVITNDIDDTEVISALKKCVGNDTHCIPVIYRMAGC